MSRIFQAVRTNLRQHWAFCGQTKQLIARRQHHLAAHTRAVLQTESESAVRAQFTDGRRTQRENLRIPHTGQRPKSAPRHRLGRAVSTFAFTKVFQRHKSQRSVLALPRKAVPQHADHALHLRLLEHEGFNLLHDRAGALLRGTRGQLYVDQQVTLVFLRQK